MAWFGSFQAKTVELSVNGSVYTVEVTDVAKPIDFLEKTPDKRLAEVSIPCDYLAKNVSKVYVDVSISCDYLRKAPSKALVEIGIPCDYVRRDVLKRLVEIGIPCDRIYKVVSRVLEFVERIYGEWLTKKEVTKRIVEPPMTVVELKFVKEVLKPLFDYVVVRDAPYRIIRLLLRDMLVGEHYVARGISPALREISRMKDVITKLAYTIYGYDVRRVYALPREWADIIEDTDQNVKIEIAKVMLEAIKRVKEKLG